MALYTFWVTNRAQLLQHLIDLCTPGSGCQIVQRLISAEVKIVQRTTFGFGFIRISIIYSIEYIDTVQSNVIFAT